MEGVKGVQLCSVVTVQRVLCKRLGTEGALETPKVIQCWNNLTSFHGNLLYILAER